MNASEDNQQKWRNLLRQQSVANGKRWLHQLQESTEPAKIITNEYENLLRALESVLKDDSTLDLAFALIQELHSIVVDFADWDRWLIYLKKGLQHSEDQNDQNKSASLWLKIGEILYHMGFAGEAEAAFWQAATHYRELGKLAQYATALNKLGVLYDLQGNTHEGIRLCQEAQEIAATIPDDWVVAQANINLSHIFRRSRNWSSSLQAANAAYDFFCKLSRKNEATKALLNIVAISADSGNWERVETLSATLMENLIASKDVRTLSQLKNNLGVVAYGQGNYTLAESFWQEALTLHSQIQEPVELAGLYNNLGMVYTQLNEWEAAADMLQKAVQAYDTLGDTYNWANALDNLADLYEIIEEEQSYQETIQLALNGLQTIQDIPHAQNLINSLRHRQQSKSA